MSPPPLSSHLLLLSQTPLSPPLPPLPPPFAPQCPTLRVNFAYNHAHHKVELVVAQQPTKEAAQLGELQLTIGWGEADGEEGATTRSTEEKLKPANPENPTSQLITLDVISRRRGRRRRRYLSESSGAQDAAADADADAAAAAPGATTALLWVSIDPALELPLRVLWTGRPDEPDWSGMPEAMCAEQLMHDRHLAGRLGRCAR